MLLIGQYSLFSSIIGQFQEAGKKGKSKKLTKQTKSKQDISHLLGFSVQGQGVNRGELDMPQ